MLPSPTLGNQTLGFHPQKPIALRENKLSNDAKNNIVAGIDPR
jgi:hypothetical protein